MTDEIKRAAQRVRYRRWLARHPEKRAEANERARQWRMHNRERQKEAEQRWTKANRDKVNAAAKRYRAKHKDKVKAAVAKWREDNKAHVSAYGAAKWRSRTPEQVEEYRQHDRKRCAKKRTSDRDGYNSRMRDWYKANPEMAKKKNARWVKSNTDAVRAARARRRAKPVDGVSFTSSDLADIRRLQDNRCGYCRCRLTSKTQHIDHIVALARGGTNRRSNIQLLCVGCNLHKSKRDPIEFAQSRGLLV